MKASERYELTKKIKELPLADQIEIAEDILRGLRISMIDGAEVERELDAMIADPEFQKMMRGEDEVKLDAAG